MNSTADSDENRSSSVCVDTEDPELAIGDDEEWAPEWVLQMKPSVYEAALVVPLFSRWTSTAWVWFLLTMNFVMQFAVVYILYTQVSAPEPAPGRDFYSRQEEGTGLCSWARSGSSASKLKGFNFTEDVLVCSMDEVLLTRDFDTPKP